VIFYRVLDLQARWLRKMSPDAQLRMWVATWDLCIPLYFAPLIFGGDWLTIFIYWLSVAALHLTAQTGITAAEALIESATNPPKDKP
jgi:hypothetical protein